MRTIPYLVSFLLLLVMVGTASATGNMTISEDVIFTSTNQTIELTSEQTFNEINVTDTCIYFDGVCGLPVAAPTISPTSLSTCTPEIASLLGLLSTFIVIVLILILVNAIGVITWDTSLNVLVSFMLAIIIAFQVTWPVVDLAVQSTCSLI